MLNFFVARIVIDIDYVVYTRFLVNYNVDSANFEIKARGFAEALAETLEQILVDPTLVRVEVIIKMIWVNSLTIEL